MTNQTPTGSRARVALQGIADRIEIRGSKLLVAFGGLEIALRDASHAGQLFTLQDQLAIDAELGDDGWHATSLRVERSFAQRAAPAPAAAAPAPAPVKSGGLGSRVTPFAGRGVNSSQGQPRPAAAAGVASRAAFKPDAAEDLDQDIPF